MAEIRNRGSVLATEEGIQILKDAKAAKRDHNGKTWTYQNIANESGVANKTVERFFRREKPIDESNARAICQALKVDFSRVVEICPNTTTFEEGEHETTWRERCRDALIHWKELTTNAVMKRSGVRFQLDEIFVPLGVVERRKQSKHRSNDGASAEQGSELYEEKITPISPSDFFEQVLRQRQSKYSQGKRIAIIGEPGAGKTTQLQKIGDWILEETDGIPIWIPLAEVGTRKLREYLLGDWLQTATQELEVPPENRDELGQLLKTGKVWLLLDGVDEMAISDALYQIATQMREGWLQNVRVVLTCRLNVWDAGKNALDGFDVYRNLDFEYPTEVHQLVDKWFSTEPALQQKLKVALEQPGKERIRDMVKNPLRLTLLCYSWQLRQGKLPETKAELYEWFVDTFYEWNKGKVPIQLSAAKRSELNRALGELAKEAIDQASSRFRLREKFVNQFLGAADDGNSLFYLALQLGWLNRIGVAEENPLENVYAFFHPTFQEYFAAVAIDDWRFFLNHNNSRPNPLLSCNGLNYTYRVFQKEWQEINIFWIGQKDRGEENERLINTLIDFEDGCGGFYSSIAYFSAIHCILEYSQSKYYLKILESLIWASGWFYSSSENRKETSKLSISPIDAKKILGGVKHEQLVTVSLRLIKSLDKDIQDEINFYNKLAIAEMLGELTSDNQEVVKIINQLGFDLERHQTYNPLIVIPTLSKLAARYPQAVNLLVRISDEDSRLVSKTTAYSGLLEQDKIFDIEDIVKQIDSCGNSPILIELLLKALYNRDPKNKKIISVLAHLLLSCNCETFYEIDLDWFFEKKEILQHPKITSALLEILNTYNEEDRECVHDFCALYLGEAQINERSIIPLLANIRDNSWDEYSRFRATKILFELGEINKAEFSATLFGFLFKFCEGLTLGLVAESLSEIYPNNWSIASFLIKRLLNPKWIDEIEWFFPSLKKVLQGKLLPIAVMTFKEHLTLTSNAKEKALHQYISLLLHHCAQNMSYPDFYRAWHSSSSCAGLSTDDGEIKL